MAPGVSHGSDCTAGEARTATALARLATALSAATDRAEVVHAVETLAAAVVAARTVRCVGPDGALDGDGWAVAPDGDAAWSCTVRLAAGHGDDIPLGAVTAYLERPGADVGSRSLLQAVADLAGQALQRIELIASAAAMARLAGRLSGTRSPAEAITVILDDAAAVLGASLPGLVIREDGDRLRFVSRLVPDELAASFTDLSLDDPRPIVEAVRTGRRIVLPDRAAFRRRYPGLVDRAAEHGIVCTAALPLNDSRGEPIAALGLGWRLPRHFGPAAISRLETLADLCEQTLERTRLVAAEHDLTTRLATRMHSAGTAVPTELDVAVRYRPAMRGLNLGGDWYDLITLAHRRFAVVVGDIVGHHIEAAADMAQLRTVLNTLIRIEVPLGDIFARFAALAGPAFLGTAVILVVDPSAARIDIARAGHPHPVLIRPGETPMAVATGRTLPLGLIGAAPAVSSVDFRPGDTVVVYTDGLVEQRRQDYDHGVVALHAVMSGAPHEASAGELADTILTSVPASEDDQALVVIRHRTTTAAAPGTPQ